MCGIYKNFNGLEKFKINMYEKIFIDSGGYKRHIGDRDRVKHRFLKQVNSKIHKFRKLDAYGIDNNTLTKLLLPDNYKIILEEVDTRKVYSTSAKEFKEKGQYYHFKDRVDHDTQLFLPLKDWHLMTEQEIYNLNN